MPTEDADRRRYRSGHWRRRRCRHFRLERQGCLIGTGAQLSSRAQRHRLGSWRCLPRRHCHEAALEVRPGARIVLRAGTHHSSEPGASGAGPLLRRAASCSRRSRPSSLHSSRKAPHDPCKRDGMADRAAVKLPSIYCPGPCSARTLPLSHWLPLVRAGTPVACVSGGHRTMIALPARRC
jgi:hypothetical protein